jgi:hypothetical protein
MKINTFRARQTTNDSENSPLGLRRAQTSIPNASLHQVKKKVSGLV